MASNMYWLYWLQFSLLPLAILIFKKTQAIKDIKYKRIAQVTIVYYAFPMVSMYSLNDVYITFVIVLYSLVNEPKCALMFLFPWFFLIGATLLELRINAVQA